MPGGNFLIRFILFVLEVFYVHALYQGDCFHGLCGLLEGPAGKGKLQQVAVPRVPAVQKDVEKIPPLPP
jgi:hypothetical protein